MTRPGTGHTPHTGAGAGQPGRHALRDTTPAIAPAGETVPVHQHWYLPGALPEHPATAHLLGGPRDPDPRYRTSRCGTTRARLWTPTTPGPGTGVTTCPHCTARPHSDTVPMD